MRETSVQGNYVQFLVVEPVGNVAGLVGVENAGPRSRTRTTTKDEDEREGSVARARPGLSSAAPAEQELPSSPKGVDQERSFPWEKIRPHDQ
jgi:hypothetical protein